jgi:hypothetical protein
MIVPCPISDVSMQGSGILDPLRPPLLSINIEKKIEIEFEV